MKSRPHPPDDAEPPARLIIADDHALVRDGLRNLLSGDAAFEIVGEAADGEALLELLQSKDCDLVVLDLSMPKLGGLEAVRRIGELYPGIKILILTMHKEPRYFRQVIAERSVSGYILKDDAYDRLRDALRRVINGEKAYSPELQRMVLEDYQVIRESYVALDALTRREREVLKLVAQGLMNKEIADRLFISVRTVETHRSRIMEKLRVKNFAELMRFAVQQGLV